MTARLTISALDTRLRKLRLADPSGQAMLQKQLEAGAMMQPVTVWQAGDGRVLVVDGFKRVDIATELGQGEVPVEFLEGKEADAIAAIVTLNASRPGLTQMEEAWVVARLRSECRLSLAAVAQLMGHGISWVSRRQLLAERLDAGLADDVRLGLLSATSAREIARLPRGKQQRAARSIAEHGLSTRQAAKMCQIALCCDPEEIDDILAQPMRWLEASDDEEAVDPRLSDKAEALRGATERLLDGARRFRTTMRRYAPGAKPPAEMDVLMPGLITVRDELRPLTQALDAFITTHEDPDDIGST